MNKLCCKLLLFTRCGICKNEWCVACWADYLDKRTTKHKCRGKIRYCQKDHDDEEACELT